MLNSLPMYRAKMAWYVTALLALGAAASLLTGCALNDGLDSAGPVIKNPVTPELTSKNLGPVAGAYNVNPPPGLTPQQTYAQFHQAVTDRNISGLYMFLSSQTRDRLAKVGLAMSVTDVPTLIDHLLNDPAFAAFAPDESIANIEVNQDRAILTTTRRYSVNMVQEDGSWRFEF
jgi:hypothetical protein